MYDHQRDDVAFTAMGESDLLSRVAAQDVVPRSFERQEAVPASPEAAKRQAVRALVRRLCHDIDST